VQVLLQGAYWHGTEANEMRIVIFTGAGAGKADGAPLQTELFQEFFSRSALVTSRAGLADQLGRFFEVVFGVNPRHQPGVPLPTFEEALGVLELAVSREEGILGVGGGQSQQDLQELRRQLILALAATVARSSTAPASYHSRLVASLREASLLSHVTFVTTNYDTLLDDGIEHEAVTGDRGTGSLVDYGFGKLVATVTGKYTETRTFPCYKIHGSLNWLYCSVCGALHITYGSDGVTRLVDEPEAARCPTCEAFRTPVIIPPSYYKNVSTSVYLATVWSMAFRALREADQIVFCGYSFPDADMHVKYLVKRAQLNRDPGTQPLRVLLVNKSPAKTSVEVLGEYGRFSRFLGGVEVRDSGLSFEDFATTAGSVLAKGI
jgi:NAD-dependent SIR2 family protein deacetylase